MRPTWRRRLDRAWTYAVWVSFICMCPIWFILSVERLGLRFVLSSIGLALAYRYFGSDKYTRLN